MRNSHFGRMLTERTSGYIIICTFIGAFLGAMIFQWDTSTRICESIPIRWLSKEGVILDSALTLLQVGLSRRTLVAAKL